MNPSKAEITRALKTLPKDGLFAILIATPEFTQLNAIKFDSIPEILLDTEKFDDKRFWDLLENPPVGAPDDEFDIIVQGVLSIAMNQGIKINPGTILVAGIQTNIFVEELTVDEAASVLSKTSGVEHLWDPEGLGERSFATIH